MKRKFYISSFHNSHVVMEIVRGGARAVSKCFLSKEEAVKALEILKGAQ